MSQNDPAAAPHDPASRPVAPPVAMDPPEGAPAQDAGLAGVGPPVAGGSNRDGPDAVDVDLFGHAPRGRPDWSHRRGEPRAFALLWTVFLTVIASTTLMRAAVGGRLDVGAYRESLRMMLMIVATAIVVAWPLLRLSQARPRGGGVGSTLKDMLIILVPLQAVVWPQAVLAHWPAGVIAGLDAILGVWTLLCGGVVALALGPPSEDPMGLPDAEVTRPERPDGRMGAMAIVIGLGAVGGACAFVLDAALRPSPEAYRPGAWWMMLSPHTAIAEVTRDRSGFGETARLESAHVVAVAAQAGAGAAMWLVAGARACLSRGRRRSRPELVGGEVAPGSPAR